MRRLLTTMIMGAVALMLFVGTADAEVPAESTASLQGPDTLFHRQHMGLQRELQRYNALGAAGGWPAVPEGPTIRPGALDPRLRTLARRLMVSGDLPAETTPSAEYDAVLEGAVRRFQLRHGLVDDGLVGRATLRAMNVSVEQRIAQIRVNLERLRALLDGEAHAETLLLVNVPEFAATVVRDGTAPRRLRVIVGSAEDPTPEMQTELTSVVFNPTWSVPHSIASEELLTKIQENADFLVNGGYQVYDRDGNRVNSADLDWHRFSVDEFPFRLVQRPGPKNQLGRIKFIVPNLYSICLHDTPARYLFDNTKRALSHGCIRVDDPLALAEDVLDGDGWARAQIDDRIESGETTTVTLAEPLAVYVVYWTAVVDDKGEAHFYNDIYGRDARFTGMSNRSTDESD